MFIVSVPAEPLLALWGKSSGALSSEFPGFPPVLIKVTLSGLVLFHKTGPPPPPPPGPELP